MASRFLRRSKAKPPLSQSGGDDARPITRTASERSKTSSGGVSAAKKENLSLPVPHIKSPKAVPQSPRSTPSLVKSSLPRKSDRVGDLGLGIQTTTASTKAASAVNLQESRLRRKRSSADNRSLYIRSESRSSSREHPQLSLKHYTASLPDDRQDKRQGTVLGISIPTVAQSATLLPTTSQGATEFATSNSRMANFMSTQLPHKLSTHDLAPPTPGFATKSSSASTRCSTTSPGPFSPVSTPTSTSSCSPAIHLSAKRGKQTPSPARHHPPVTRRRGTDGESHELSALEELSIRSSVLLSSPEANTSDTQERQAPSGNMHGKLPTGAPIPPLRVSSKRLPRPKAESLPSTASRPTRDSGNSSLQDEEQVHDPSKGDVKRRIPLSKAFENPRRPPPLPNMKHASELTTQAHDNHANQPTPEVKSSTPIPTKVSNDPKLPSEPDPTQSRPSALRSASLTGASRIPTRSPLINSNGIPAVKAPFRSVASPKPLPSKPDGPKKLTKSPSRERTDSPGKSTGRLNLFSRRTRLGSNGVDAEQPFKKGPAAGTGHEGYGKYARRGRTSSIGTASNRGRSTSDESDSEFSYGARSGRKSSFASQSGSDLDDFYKDRLEPVIIRGGTPVLGHEWSRLGSFGADTKQFSIRADSSVESLPAAKPTQRTPIKLGLPVSPRDTDVMTRFPKRASMLQEPGQQELPGAESPQPTLAARRSFTQSQNSKELVPLKVPPPIAISALQVSPSLGSFETIVSAAPRTDSSIFGDDILDAPVTGSWSKARRLFDRALPSKSNFFRRAQDSFAESADFQIELEAQELFATVTEVPDYRAVAHYCMLDDPDQEVKKTLEDLLHDIEDDLELRRSYDARDRESGQAFYRQPSVLLPSPPPVPRAFSPIRTSGERFTPRTEEMSTLPSVGRPRLEPSLLALKEELEPIASHAKSPRLAQVGRIPKVVSKKDHLHKPPPRSFSRPFPREEYPSVAHAHQPAEEATTQPNEAHHLHFDAELDMNAPNLVAEPAVRFSHEKEFIPSSPRKRSGLSGSTNSSGMFDLSAITAVRPDSTASLDEDEIWNEYDELFDRAVFPYTSSTGFSLATYPDSTTTTRALATNLDATQDPARRRESRLSDPSSPRSMIRAHQLSNALLEFPTPPPPSSNAPKAVEFAEPKPITRLNSTSSRKSHHSHLSKSNSQSSRSSRRSTRPQTLSQIIERKSRQSDSSFCRDLRYHAVMMSQYLSFSRVLFSPVHMEVSTHISERVLILDGLGNDDWSLYCALKYPEATIYNLGTSRPLSGWRRDSAASTSLANHRQIQHVGIDHPFPFPKGFFAAVVWRFPTAGSEAAYCSAISEAKRVLRPGGYLELTVLDMDPVNMGNFARRAVRGLKVSMQASDPDLSLAPAGDCIQKMLGRKGFENMSRCVVGIPVVGGFGDNRPSDCRDARQGNVGSEKAGFDFGDDGQDRSSLDDTSILQMVGSVGRWWWARCFEQWGSKPEAIDEVESRRPSTWDDLAVLDECEERATNFKLLLCYAQKPAVTRRRTVSV